MPARVLPVLALMLVALCGLPRALGTLAPAAAQVLLEVHPNERGLGPPTVSLKPGGPFWIWPTPSGSGSYTWKVHRFAGSGSLWIQVCAQAYAAFQNKPHTGFGNQDSLLLVVDGVTPSDVWGIQTGPLGGYQWKGDVDQGRRLTLEFLVTGLTPGPHTLRLTGSMCPTIYWIKVYDLEKRCDIRYNITDYWPLGQGDYYDFGDEEVSNHTVSGTREVDGVETVRWCALDMAYDPPCATEVEYYRSNPGVGIELYGYSDMDCSQGGVEVEYATCSPPDGPHLILDGLCVGDRVTQEVTFTDHPSGWRHTKTQTYTLLGVEDVTVPAGTFLGCLKFEWEEWFWEPEVDGFFRMWFAPGVGFVKVQIEPAGGEMVTAQLAHAVVGGVPYP